jgi:tRNA-dihydrouridine synthase A
MRGNVFFLLIIAACTWKGMGIKFHIAPMQGYTDCHLRYMYRLLSPDAVLWSEMLKPKDIFDVTDHKLEKLLTRGAEQHISRNASCVLQLGGDNVDDLIACIVAAKPFGYTQFDLNCGCPSIETNAHFGAALMQRPDDVAYIIDKMAATAGGVPVSVKCRIGVHNSYKTMKPDVYEHLLEFVSRVTESGSCRDVTVHARAAVLQGLSPERNREVPPLRYDFVDKLVVAMPHLRVTLNGGISSCAEVFDHAGTGLDGVMAGRWCLRSPLEVVRMHSMDAIEEERLVMAALSSYGDYALAEIGSRRRVEWPDVLAPLCILFNSLERLDGAELDAKDMRLSSQRMRYLIEILLPVLSAMDVTGKLTRDINEISGALYGESIDTYPTKKVKKLLIMLSGKKLLSKLKGNSEEVLRSL